VCIYLVCVFVDFKLKLITFVFRAYLIIYEYMKSSDAKASKCHLKFSSRMILFIKLVYLS